ncbi:MAG: hypothetical protein IBX44_07000 [Sulfurospirillum sp.]|nr:hypothetical protein [Sulfurospirillum sp.]
MQNTFAPQPKSIFLSYEESPARIYAGGLFELKLKAIIAHDDFDDISTDFLADTNLTVLNKDAKWQWYSDNIFYNTFYFKLADEQTQLPRIKLNLLQNSQIIASEILERATIDIVTLKSDKLYSQVIAKDLKVIKYKTTQFNDKSYIVVLEIEAEYANLSDFHLSWVIKDGIDSSRENLISSKIFYYAIIPNHEKQFTFTYFDSNKQDFQKISLPVVLDDDSVSTQIDLNPKESGIQTYKNILYLVIVLFCTIVFLRRKKGIYLLIMILFIGVFLYEKAPINSVKLAPKTQVRILPTQNSTVFYTLDRAMYGEKLAKRKNYIKIILPNGKIGWIKEKNVLQD